MEVAVIGAGQTGLATGRFLAQQGRRFVILESAGDIAPAWRQHGSDKAAITKRLHRIEGQVRGTDRMVESDRYGDPKQVSEKSRELLEAVQRFARR